MKDKELSENTTNDADQSRRRFLKGAAYVAPVILTLKAAPGFAGTGSQSYKPGGPPSSFPGNGVGPANGKTPWS